MDKWLGICAKIAQVDFMHLVINDSIFYILENENIISRPSESK